MGDFTFEQWVAEYSYRPQCGRWRGGTGVTMVTVPVHKHSTPAHHHRHSYRLGGRGSMPADQNIYHINTDKMTSIIRAKCIVIGEYYPAARQKNTIIYKLYDCRIFQIVVTIK